MHNSCLWPWEKFVPPSETSPLKSKNGDRFAPSSFVRDGSSSSGLIKCTRRKASKISESVYSENISKADRSVPERIVGSVHSWFKTRKGRSAKLTLRLETTQHTLGNNGQSSSQISQTNRWNIDSINSNRPSPRLHESEETQSDRTLSRSSRSDDSDLLSCSDWEIDIMKNVRQRWIVSIFAPVHRGKFRIDSRRWDFEWTNLILRSLTWIRPFEGQVASGRG